MSNSTELLAVDQDGGDDKLLVVEAFAAAVEGLAVNKNLSSGPGFILTHTTVRRGEHAGSSCGRRNEAERR